MPSAGDTATVSFTVTDAETAAELGSGDVPVLGTPKVVALCEEAAVAALGGTLAEGSTSVGTHISIYHTAPTPVGRTVSATASVTAIDGRTVDFAVSVTDGDSIVATGRHTRVVVDRERFVTELS